MIQYIINGMYYQFKYNIQTRSIRSKFQYFNIARFSPITDVYDCLKDIVFTKHIIHVPHLYFRAKIDNGIKSIYAQGKNCYVIKMIISISAGPPSVLH